MVASVAGHVPSALMSAYCASKFALVGFTESLRLELLAQNSPVKLSLISPGFIATPLVRLGEIGGFPEELAWLLGQPKTAAKEMAQAILKGRARCVPTFNGKVMRLLNYLCPWALRSFNIQLAVKTLRRIKTK
jgi:short-subunit dehydrogenase